MGGGVLEAYQNGAGLRMRTSVERLLNSFELWDYAYLSDK